MLEKLKKILKVFWKCKYIDYFVVFCALGAVILLW